MSFFLKYLNLSNTYKPNETTSDIISIFKTGVSTTKIKEYISTAIYNEVSIWIKEKVLKILTPNTGERIKLLRNWAISNCLQGMQFIQVFNSATHKSIRIVENPNPPSTSKFDVKLRNENTCIQNVDVIFKST